MSSSRSIDSDFSASSYVCIDTNGGDRNDALELLSQGLDLSIIIGMKALFEKIMSVLPVPEPPVFTVDHCDEAGVRVTINLDVSNLPSASGQSIWFSVVEGETMLNPTSAECSAIKSALKLLEKNHLIRIVDFSSMVVERIVRNDTNELLSQGIVALDNVLAQWHLTVRNLEEVVSKLEIKESSGNMFGPRTPSGMVYGILSDYLSDLRNTFYRRTNDAKLGLSDAKDQFGRYQIFLEEKVENSSNIQPFLDAPLSLKFILEYVMRFLGVEIPNYVCTPEPHGFVKSKITFKFPYMENFKYGGMIQLEGQSHTSVEAEEEAAYQAILFIQENFRIKVIDYNYSQRKKALQQQSSLFQKLDNILDHADSLKMMFGELLTAIEAQRQQFSFDPTLLFTGLTSTGQIDAFHFCSTSLVDLDQYTVDCYGACGRHFEVLKKLTWKLLAMKTNVTV